MPTRGTLADQSDIRAPFSSGRPDRLYPHGGTSDTVCTGGARAYVFSERDLIGWRQAAKQELICEVVGVLRATVFGHASPYKGTRLAILIYGLA
jgi:hypothetical protein